MRPVGTMKCDNLFLFKICHNNVKGLFNPVWKMVVPCCVVF